MSPVPEPENHRRRLAVAAARAGYRIFPLKPNTKAPATPNGFKDATSDIEQIEAWWERNPDYNIGLATGMQDNGLWVGVVDVDAKHGGVLAWKQLTREHGGTWQRYMPIHKTPRHGFHIFGQADPELGLNSSNGFPKGIDTRGDGGYVVLPDSVFIDTETGEIGSYVATPNNVWSIEAGTFPDWVLEAWKAGPAIERIVFASRASLTSGGDDPMTWMKHNLDWQAELAEDGFMVWQVAGEEVRFTRPGKNKGNSLSLHHDGVSGVAVVFSDECPDWMTKLGCGQPTKGGFWSLNGFQYYAAKYHGGDIQEAMSVIRREMMPAPPIASADRPAPTGLVEPERKPSTLIHPPEFWLQLPLLTLLRDAAWSMGASPDAMLLAWLTHFATAIPAGYRLPPIIGDDGTFDLLSVLVGDSGAKKSSVMRRTERLTPLAQRKDLQVGLDIGSGEGIIEAFYDMLPEDPDDPKSKKEKRRAYAGLNFKVDEGKLINDLSHRQGTTHTSRLCSAWSGSTLSTTNASAERKRRIDEFTYRITAVICAQPAYAVAYLHGDSALQGFAQRLLWAWCHDPSKPEPGMRPEWPGVLDIQVPPGVGLAYIDCAPEITAQIQWEDHNEEHVGLDAHRNLLRLKLAGIMGLASDPYCRLIGTDMWDIAGQILTQSVVVRDHLLRQETTQAQMDEVAKAEATGRRLALAEDAHDRAILGRVTDRILAVLAACGPLNRKQLKDKLSRPQRPFMDAALDILTGLGKVVGEAGGTWKLT